MLIKSKGIVLSSKPYSDNSVIARVYTLEHGKLSFLVNGVRNGKGSIKPSHLLALTPVELDYYYKNKDGLLRIKDLKVQLPLSNSRQSLVKNSLIFFMSEVLLKALEDQYPSEELFDFLERTINFIEEAPEQELSCLPSYFVMKVCKLLGHHPPELSNPKGLFHLELNEFVPASHTSIYTTRTEEETKHFFCLSHNKYDQLLEQQWDKQTRNQLLELSIKYLAVNVNKNIKIKSYAVLAAL